MRGRCLPHRKQDIVELPVLDGLLNGEPETLDLQRRPSSITVVLLGDLLMVEFYLSHDFPLLKSQLPPASSPEEL